MRRKAAEATKTKKGAKGTVVANARKAIEER